MVELNEPTFWVVGGAAVLLLATTRALAVRKAVLASVNVALLVSLAGSQALGLLGAIGVAWVVLRTVARPRYRVAFSVLAAAILGILFVLHKAPGVVELPGSGGLTRVLTIVGYSYVMLRLIEVLRAVVDGRHIPPDPVSLLNYLLPFHMLAAGPIQSYDDFVTHADDQFEPGAGAVMGGVERIASGLFKKFVLAHLLQTTFLTNFEAAGPYFFVEMQIAFVWLFLDFSAYSDIAVGMGTLMGVATPENFNRPLQARNLIDFWDRWHISLSLFIRRNIFIPLQLWLMRRNEGRTPLLSACVAVAVAFILCGLWHGLGVGFLIWGGVQAAGLVIARVYGHLLQGRLGRAGVQAYLRNPALRAVAVILTFEVQAVALVALITA